MRFSFQAIILAVLCAVFGYTPSTSVKSPPGWTTVDAGAFKFSVPPDLKLVVVHGIDSFVGKYKSNTMSFGFDYSMYSNPLNYEGYAAYASHFERIDGKRAKIVSRYYAGDGPFDYDIGVHFPDVNEKDVKLTVEVACKTTKEYETATTIFRTIRFKP